MSDTKNKPPVVDASFWRSNRHLDGVSQMLLVAREYGSFVRAGKFSHDYIVADADVIHHILVSERDAYRKGNFAFGRMARLVGEGLLTNLTSTWFERRKLLQKLFTRDYLDAYAKQTIKAMPSFLTYWEEQANSQAPINLYDDMMMLVFTNVARHFLGDEIPRDKARELVKATADAQSGVRYQFALSPWFPSPTYVRFRIGCFKIDKYVKALISRHKRMDNPPDDLMTFLLQHKASRQVLLDESKTAIVAGHETTGTALTWCYHLLMKHPDVYQRMQMEVISVLGDREMQLEDLEQMPYLRAVFDESLRLYPPTWGLPRTAVQPDTLLGYEVPAGAGFIISPYVIHRLEKYWDDPGIFKPERFMGSHKKKIYKNAYIPFNTGPHMCIAKQLALRQAQIILAMIAQRFNLRRVSENTDPMPHELFITMRPKEQILVQLEKRTVCL